MNEVKKSICDKLRDMESRNRQKAAALSDRVKLTDYRHLVRREKNGDAVVDIWTESFSAALREHEIVDIPAAEVPYYIDGTVSVPSHRRIEADEGAIIRQTTGTKVLLLKNEHTADGTHAPIPKGHEDENITIIGGRWEESYTERLGYGKSGMYDENRSFFGVSTCMLFNNVKNLTVSNVVFAHTAGFALQAGDALDCLFENIRFESCYADGLHINGNTENVWIRNVSGEVGDDLVALNMYDWQDSSVDFGPMKTVLCENAELSPSSHYKAFRIVPGLYRYDDGSVVDCTAEDIIVKNVRGILCYKMYFQTPVYQLGTEPEWGRVGSGRNIFFEDITVDLTEPIDRLEPYMTSDPVRGCFAAFEMGANLESVTFENVNITLRKDIFPLSFLACIGPKSVVFGDNEDQEIFDPYLESKVDKLTLKNVTVNGSTTYRTEDIIKEISFDDINRDGHSSGCGRLGEIVTE